MSLGLLITHNRSQKQPVVAKLITAQLNDCVCDRLCPTNKPVAQKLIDCILYSTHQVQSFLHMQIVCGHIEFTRLHKRITEV